MPRPHVADRGRKFALDEALLEEAEATAAPTETLRLWESPQPLVVIGRSSRIDAEVRVDVCRASGIPILRRVSGGAAVVAGPGCLMYALVLSYRLRPHLRMLSQAHRHVLNMLASALGSLVSGVQCAARATWPWGVEVFGQQCPLPPRSLSVPRHAAVRLSVGVDRGLSGHAAADA